MSFFRHRAAALIAMAGVACAAAVFSGCRTRPRPPLNVIILCLDTVRYDTFWLPEAAGIADPLSPWNRKAIRYRRAHSVSSWTVPTVGSVLSGLYPIQHGAGSFKERVADFQQTTIPLGLPKSVTTLAEVLSGQGYETAALLSNPFIGRESGVMQGFTTVDDEDIAGLPSQSSAWLQARAESKQPFFLYMQSMEAHGEHWNALESVKQLGGRIPSGIRRHIVQDGTPPPCREPDSEWCARYEAYVATVLEARRNVATLLATLERTGLLSRTVLIIYSDHGEEFLDHKERDEELRKDPRGIYGAGHGHSLSEVLLHIPLLVWHPKEEQRDVEELVSLVDITPTVRDWLGLSPGEGEEGLSIAPERLDASPETYRDRAVYASGVAYGAGQFALLWDRWKRIEYSCPSNILIHDLRADPGEKQTLSRQTAPRKLEILAAAYRNLARHPTEEMAKLSPEQVARLRALGYLQPGGRSADAQCTEQDTPPRAGAPAAR